jgi:hypothetical protein
MDLQKCSNSIEAGKSTLNCVDDLSYLSIPLYFQLATVVVDARIAEQVTVENWRKVTNKMIYLGYSDEFPVPKVERESGVSYKQVWRRLCNPCLTSSSREILFLLLHNKLPVRERFFRIRWKLILIVIIAWTLLELRFVMWSIFSALVTGWQKLGGG